MSSTARDSCISLHEPRTVCSTWIDRPAFCWRQQLSASQHGLYIPCFGDVMMTCCWLILTVPCSCPKCGAGAAWTSLRQTRPRSVRWPAQRCGCNSSCQLPFEDSWSYRSVQRLRRAASPLRDCGKPDAVKVHMTDVAPICCTPWRLKCRSASMFPMVLVGSQDSSAPGFPIFGMRFEGRGLGLTTNVRGEF